MCSFGCFLLNLLCFCTVVKVGRSSENRSIVLNRTSRQVGVQGCKLPQHPAFGKWSIYEETSTNHPGQVVPHRTILQVICQEKYSLDGDEIVLCKKGVWSAVIGTCLQTCPSRYSTSTMNITCTKNGAKLENCENPTDGTRAHFECAHFYEDPAIDIHPFHICFNGVWNHRLPECNPICGQKSPMVDPTLINKGHNVTKGEYPWQVALYDSRTKEQLCGGSLLSQRVVLTAAHCITSLNGTALPKELYLVAVGKYFRKFDHPEDRDVAQFSQILEMHPHSDYFGEEENYFADIAVVVLKKTFTFTLRVQPVCVDYALRRFPTTLPTKIGDGYVTGWGFTEQNKNPSSVLKELKVPIIERRECKDKVADDYRRYVMNDKVCAGYSNIGASVCKGDSGGGLVVRHKDRFYVIGIVSLAPQAQKGGCDSNQYGVYTKVQKYVDFIYEKVESFRLLTWNCDDSSCEGGSPISEDTTTTTTTVRPTTQKPIHKDGCILPEHPVSGNWSILGSTTSMSPGMTTSTETILRISCNENHKLNGNNLLVCLNGSWSSSFGKCLRTCPSLVSSETGSYICSFNDRRLEDCSSPVEGTIAKQQCAPFYESLARIPVHICRDGTWSGSTSECVPVCGQKPIHLQSLILQGDPNPKVDFPWQVAIYNLGDKDFFCSGVLISQRLILTSAHCVRNPYKRPESISNYIVAAGKLFRDFNDTRDKFAQFAKLQQVLLSPNYEYKNPGYYFGDIAVLVTNKPFIPSRFVQPVCVGWNQKSSQNPIGQVIGWGDNPSVPSKSYNLLITPDPLCYSEANENKTDFGSDKFCVSHHQGEPGCGQDSRAPFLKQQEGRYYIAGIFSSPVKNGCGSDQMGLYTTVSNYIDFVTEIDSKIKGETCSNDGDCQIGTSKSEPQQPCSLPNHPEFGKLSIVGRSTYISNSSVPSSAVLLLTCDKSYKPSGNEQVFCKNGNWSSRIGNCLKTCPSVHNTTERIEVDCITPEREPSNCEEPIEGTILRYKCIPFYEDPQAERNYNYACQNGSWNTAGTCRPVCGKLDTDNSSNLASDYPWKVGIYKGSESISSCNGVLISERIVLTVAQCLTKVWNVLPLKDQFSVVAEKHGNSSQVQTSKVSEIFIHPKFKKVGSGFINNIAVVVTSQSFILYKSLQPVCVDWNSSYYKSLKSNPYGYVFKHVQAPERPDWFYPDQFQDFARVSRLSEGLQNLQVRIVDEEKCREAFPGRFVNSTGDKFCSDYEGKSICRGVSGDGLVVKFQGRYYLAGILETPESTSFSGCGVQDYEIFTNISTYLDDFISPRMNQNEDSFKVTQLVK